MHRNHSGEFRRIILSCFQFPCSSGCVLPSVTGTDFHWLLLFCSCSSSDFHDHPAGCGAHRRRFLRAVQNSLPTGEFTALKTWNHKNHNNKKKKLRSSQQSCDPEICHLEIQWLFFWPDRFLSRAVFNKIPFVEISHINFYKLSSSV